MISAILYLINGIILSIFCSKVYLSVSGKISKNPFSAYFLWVTFFYAINFLLGAILIVAAILLSNASLLFWVDYIGRVLFYAGAIFAVQIPLYKYFPNNKKRFILSYLFGITGVVLSVYQLFVRNAPSINGDGIVDWKANAILGGCMAVLVVVPWAATSIIFILEFVRSKFKLLKPFFLGTGFLLIAIGGIFTDLATTTLFYVFFGILSAAGFLLVLSGMFYGEE